LRVKAVRLLESTASERVQRRLHIITELNATASALRPSADGRKWRNF
jgi:hypothetical protein